MLLSPSGFSVQVPEVEARAQGKVGVPPLVDMVQGSAVLSRVSDLDGFEAGVLISGPGIPANTRVWIVNQAAQTVTLTAAVGGTVNRAEVRLANRQYIPRRVINYGPVVTRNGPNVSV